MVLAQFAFRLLAQTMPASEGTMKVQTFTVATAVAAFLAASTIATYAQPGSGTGSGSGSGTRSTITAPATTAPRTTAPAAAQPRQIYVAPAQPQPVSVVPAQPQIVYVDCTKKKIVRTNNDGDRKVTKKEVCR